MRDQKSLIHFFIFQKVDIRVGIISLAEVAEGCRAPAYQLEIDFGANIGSKKALPKQLTMQLTLLLENKCLQ